MSDTKKEETSWWTAKSRCSEIAEKLRPHFMTPFSTKMEFRSALKFLMNSSVISRSDYSYSIANLYRLILELKFYHLLVSDDPTQIRGSMESLWNSLTEQLLQVLVSGKSFYSISAIISYLQEKLSIIGASAGASVSNGMPIDSISEGESPFDSATKALEELFRKEGSSIHTFQESLKATQKILFNLREQLAHKGAPSPILYEILKTARELPRHQTSEKNILIGTKAKLSEWKNRARNP